MLCNGTVTMPRKSKQRGDKYGPLAQARRRRGQRAMANTHEGLVGNNVAITLDELMVGQCQSTQL